MKRFSETVQAATSAVASASSSLPPVLEAPSVEVNDVDSGDLPSSRDMDIDQGQEDASDKEGSICSQPDVPVEDIEGKEEEALYTHSVNAATCALLDGVDLNNIDDVFDFLPNPDLDDTTEGEASAGPSGTATTYRPMHRTLVDDDAESRTYAWHSSAGKGQEDRRANIHARWEALFGYRAGTSNASDDQYKPFQSRLDWEIAQWAITENITQRSLNRLLEIPQVSLLPARHSMILMDTLSTR